MFGSYRLFLALLVVLSHFGLIIQGLNPGQWAVICFYVLSGFLMERQYHKLAQSGGIFSFYLDRLLRIYPIYLITTILCAIATPVGLRDTIINLALLPLNYSTLHISLFWLDPRGRLHARLTFTCLSPCFQAYRRAHSEFSWRSAWGYLPFQGFCLKARSGPILGYQELYLHFCLGF